MTYRLSRRAQQDVREIWAYIARDSVDAAGRVENAFAEAAERLCLFPGMGHPRDDSPNPNYLFWPVYSYLLVYRVRGKTLTIVRIIDGRRNVRRALK